MAYIPIAKARGFTPNFGLRGEAYKTKKRILFF